MARHLIQGVQLEWSLCIGRKCAEVFILSCQTCAVLRSLTTMSPYAFMGLSVCGGIDSSRTEESLALTPSFGRCLYEVRCLSLVVLHQTLVKHLVNSPPSLMCFKCGSKPPPKEAWTTVLMQIRSLLWMQLIWIRSGFDPHLIWINGPCERGLSGRTSSWRKVITSSLLNYRHNPLNKDGNISL